MTRMLEPEVLESPRYLNQMMGEIQLEAATRSESWNACPRIN
jgi:hypothetical protein